VTSWLHDGSRGARSAARASLAGLDCTASAGEIGTGLVGAAAGAAGKGHDGPSICL